MRLLPTSAVSRPPEKDPPLHNLTFCAAPSKPLRLQPHKVTRARGRLIEQIRTLIAENNLTNVILAGHSYGGMVITGVAAGMVDRIGRLLYVDAALPDPGQSLFDIIVTGGCDPLSFTGLESAPPYVEKLQFDPAAIAHIPKTYVLCTESEFAVVTKVAKRKIVAAGNGWKYLELPTSHVPMATMPDRFAELLLEAGSQ